MRSRRIWHTECNCALGRNGRRRRLSSPFTSTNEWHSLPRETMNIPIRFDSKFGVVVVVLCAVFAGAVVSADDPEYVASLRFTPDGSTQEEPDFDDRRHDEFDQDPFEEDYSEYVVEPDASPARTFERLASRRRANSQLRFPAEFEKQSSLMVSGAGLHDFAPQVLSDIARAVDGHLKLQLLVNNAYDLHDVEELLSARGIVSPRSFLLIEHNTIWARDYGPVVMQSNRRAGLVVDAAYMDPEREKDDEVPSAIARMANSSTRHTSLNLPGGNLLSNGRGVVLTTTRVQQDNPDETQKAIAREIVEIYGATTLAILEPLDGERTGHVDMFATFTDERTVVVGKYDLHVDPVNSRILDRNAVQLSKIRVGGQKLRVVRIRMPSRRDGRWPTFTNVVYANGRLLVPCYESTTKRELKSVRDLYSVLLPGWEIHFIRSDELIKSGGALHCVISNLNRLSPQSSGSGQTETASWEFANGAPGSPRRTRIVFRN